LGSRPVNTDAADFFQICEPKFDSKSPVNSAARGTKKLEKIGTVRPPTGVPSPSGPRVEILL
jgi:hypothetical protein